MTEPSKKKHLPVVGNPEPERAVPASHWVWVLLGGVVIVSVWVPMALIALFLGNKVVAIIASFTGTSSVHSFALMAPRALLVLLSFAFACAIGGAAIGRFADRARRTDPGLSGTVSVCLVLLLAALGHALRPLIVGAVVAVCLMSIAFPLASLGGRWGRKRRAQEDD